MVVAILAAALGRGIEGTHGLVVAVAAAVAAVAEPVPGGVAGDRVDGAGVGTLAGVADAAEAFDAPSG